MFLKICCAAVLAAQIATRQSFDEVQNAAIEQHSNDDTQNAAAEQHSNDEAQNAAAEQHSNDDAPQPPSSDQQETTP